MSRFGPEFERRFRKLVDVAEIELVGGDGDLLDRLAAKLEMQRDEVTTLIAEASAQLTRAGVDLPVGATSVHALVHVAGSSRRVTDDDAARVYTVGPIGEADRYSVVDSVPVSDGGGQGIVFRAVARRFGRSVDVALKQLRTVPPEEAAALAERLAPMAGFRHRHLARHFEVFVGKPLGAESETDAAIEVVYVASAWVHGKLLSDVVEDHPPLTRLRWVVDVGRAASALHERVTDRSPEGLIHRDIKPGNIIIDPEGRAVLIDYGLVRAISAEPTDTKAFTLRWMAPETIRDPDAASPRSDGWAVGQLAYWMICKSEIRWPRKPSEHKDAMREATLSEGVPGAEELAGHVVTMLAEHPADRPDLAPWCDELERLIGGDGGRRKSRWRRWALALLTCAGLAAATGYVAIGRGDDGHDRDLDRGSSVSTVTLLQGTNGADTFLDPVNAAGPGEPVPPSTEVEIECKVHAPQILTANPAGYWYRLASPPWNGRYYIVANTFFNAGDIPGRRPYLYDVDPSVPDCPDFDWGDRTLSDVVDLVDAACVKNQAVLADVRSRLAVFADRSADRQRRIDAGSGAVEQMIRNTIVGSLPRPVNEADRRIIDQFVIDYYAAAYWFEVGADELEAGGSTGTADASIAAGVVAITNAVDTIVRLGADNCDGPT